VRAREREAERFRLAAGAFIVAASVAVVIVILIAMQLVRGIRRPLTRFFDGIRKIGDGELAHRLPEDGTELGRLAKAFNRMAAQLHEEQATRQAVEAQLAKTNSDLVQSAAEIEARRRATDLLARMAHRLQGCSNEGEFVQVVERFGAQIVPETPAALYILGNSHNLLRTAARWNAPAALEMDFAPTECWALRRGQPHIIEDVSLDVVCRHVDQGRVTAYLCLPLVAQGETVGLLYFEHKSGNAHAVSAASALAETIAPALVNLRLRESLRNQSIRDPMTGLFNRRYLAESLELDLARAARGDIPVSVMMIDADHFKRFNDAFGHDAGDAVLKQIGHLLTSHIRKGDIACRFGGEEFTLVLPGATMIEARRRAEGICEAAKSLHVSHRGRTLGPVTLSIGVATFPEHGRTGDEIIAAADGALYAAKRAGRDRVVTAVTADAEPVAAPLLVEG
jgi:diguanylate cyclase (GGDEF)-like protein